MDRAINYKITTRNDLRQHGAILTIYKWQPMNNSSLNGIKCRCRNQALLRQHQQEASATNYITAPDTLAESLSNDFPLTESPSTDLPMPELSSISPAEEIGSTVLFSAQTDVLVRQHVTIDMEPDKHPSIAVTPPHFEKDSNSNSSQDSSARERKAFQTYFHTEMRKLPPETKSKRRKKLLQKTILPRLAKLYGGEEPLANSLLATPFLKKYEEKKAEEQMQKHTNELQAALNEGRRQAVKRIEEEYEITAPLALEGTRQSKAGQKDLREVTAFEPLSTAKKRSEHSRSRKPVPEVALASPQLREHLCAFVKVSGGGDKVDATKGGWRKILKMLSDLYAVLPQQSNDTVNVTAQQTSQDSTASPTSTQGSAPSSTPTQDSTASPTSTQGSAPLSTPTQSPTSSTPVLQQPTTVPPHSNAANFVQQTLSFGKPTPSPSQVHASNRRRKRETLLTSQAKRRRTKHSDTKTSKNTQREEPKSKRRKKIIQPSTTVSTTASPASEQSTSQTNISVSQLPASDSQAPPVQGTGALTATPELKEWLLKPDNATHLKTLYLEQISLDTKALETVDIHLLQKSVEVAFTPPDAQKKKKKKRSRVYYEDHKFELSVAERVKLVNALPKDDTWKHLSCKLRDASLLPDLYDLDYLLREHYKHARGLAIRHRRLRKELFPGVRMPTLPPVRRTAERLITREVEDTDAKPLTDPEIETLLDKNQVFIGHVQDMTMEVSSDKKKKVLLKRTVPLRLLDPRVQLISLLRTLIDRKILIPNAPEIDIEFADWFDGSTSLSWPVFAMMVGILYNPDLFKDESQFDLVTKMKPIAVGLCKESVKSVRQLRKWEGKMFRERLETPWEYNGVKYRFIPCVCRGDHSARSKGGDNQVGGHHRCDLCGASWATADKSSLWNLKTMASTFQKSLSSVIELQRLNPVRANSVGSTQRHPFLPSNCTRKEHLAALRLQFYAIGIDPLHDIGGCLKKVSTLSSFLVSIFKERRAFSWIFSLEVFFFSYLCLSFLFKDAQT